MKNLPMFEYPNIKKVKNKLKNCKYEYGFLTLSNNNSMFINIATWVTIKSEDNWISDLSRLRKEIKIFLFNNLNGAIFDNRNYIVDAEYRETGLKQNMRIYVDFEITLFSTPHKFFDQDMVLKMEIERLINLLIEEKLQNNKKFSFSLK